MTVTEMREKLEELERHGHGDDKIRVRTADPSVGAVATVEITYVYPGFDWENGMTLINVEPKVIRKGDAE